MNRYKPIFGSGLPTYCRRTRISSVKYKIYFADLTHTGVGINANIFPLGIGLVAAYAAREFKDEIDVDIFKYPDDLNQALSREMPDVLCMSNYAWNANLSYAFAD